jgi:hypothetical protein
MADRMTTSVWRSRFAFGSTLGSRSRTRTGDPFLTISRRRFAGACGCSRFLLVSADFATNEGDSFAAVFGCCVAQCVAHLTSPNFSVASVGGVVLRVLGYRSSAASSRTSTRTSTTVHFGTARVESVKTAIPDLHGHLLSTQLVDRLQEARIYGSARAPPLANHNHFGGE